MTTRTVVRVRSALSVAALLVCAAALMTPAQAEARAGKVLFVLGGASIERGQTALAAQRGAAVEAGDTLVTGLSGRMHVRMSDGALISLKPDTRFTIEAYEPPAAADTAAPAPEDRARNPADRNAAQASQDNLVGQARPQGLAVLSLLRGGFRTITGLIGKQDKAAYQLKTPVATIGIRGTDYSVYQCASNCSNADGLYLGVWAGGLVVSNDGGTEEFDAGEFGYVASQASPPTQTQGDPVVTTDTPPPPGDDEGEDEGSEDAEDTASDSANTGSDDPPASTDPQNDGENTGDSFAEGGSETAPPQNRPVEPPVNDTDDEPAPDNRPFRSVAYGPVPDGEDGQFVSASTTRNAALNNDNELVAFVGGHPNGTGDYRIGTAEAINLGFDPDTGIRWGRWAGGTATVAVDGGAAQNLDLNDSSLHYVVTPAMASVPAIPIEGTASYTLVGNTNPTDTNGNVGVLGSAFFGANFTNQTVESSINLSINDDVWNASGGGSIANGTNLFGGNYDAVDINGQSPTGAGGFFSGFFGSPSSSGSTLAGAGLTYTLTDGATDVSGAAVFGEPTTGASTGGQ